MNILFFLTPKIETAFIFSDDTLRQALEKMEHHRYTSLPILSRQGHYIGTLTEGDLLWAIKNNLKLSLKSAEEIPITDIPRHKDNTPVHIQCDMEDLITASMKQNFVPVIDDTETFIGIVTRKDIIEYLYKKSCDSTPSLLNIS